MKFFLSATLLACLLLPEALAYDDAGHLLIAQIAYQRLSPLEQQKLQSELSGLSEGGHTYNAISAACYMDDLRRDKKLFGDWHYIAPPFTLSGKPLPIGQNIVRALNYCVTIYKGQVSDARISRQQALAMIMHLAGDIHQPLHCTSHTLNGKNDKNGNAVVVTNMPDAEYQNLHSFWDSAFQRSWANGTVTKTYSLSRPAALTSTSVSARAATLVSNFPVSAHWKSGGFNPATWALQSHRVGFRSGYKNLPGGENSSSITLDDSYVAVAHDADCRQMVLAGYRLAALLKGLLYAVVGSESKFGGNL